MNLLSTEGCRLSKSQRLILFDSDWKQHLKPDKKLNIFGVTKDPFYVYGLAGPTS